MADPIAEREAEVTALVARLRAGEPVTEADIETILRNQADFVSAAMGLVASNAEIARVKLLHPDAFPAEE